MPVSAVILTKNAENTIQKCLEHLNWCDEIIVIDDNSADKTVAIAKKMGAKVIQHTLGDNFAQQRNLAFEYVTSNWVFFVDADEIIPESLKNEIQIELKQQSSDIQGFMICRQDIVWGKRLTHGEWGKQWLVRLGKKNVGKWYGKVHESWHIHGNVKKIQHTLEHYPHKTVGGFLQKINFYTSLRAQELFDQHVPVSWLDIILYPKAKFFVNYILKLGFLDGIPGFLTAILMSFHSFLVRAKLWQLHQKLS